MENTVIHRADTRGVADFGWLRSFHTFSFSGYYNPDRMNFGALRVLNDDTVAPGMGFGQHPHSNMEIISIPLQGALKHRDSMGNETVIIKGDIQIMSAGTGVEHSEMNNDKDREVRFLQIWVIPKQPDIKPRYDQITLTEGDRLNRFQQIISPDPDGEGIQINQDAWFHLGKLEKDIAVDCELKGKGTGVYAFILEGSATINGQKLNRRDGFGIWDVGRITVKADSDTEILLMEVPMTF